MVEAPDVHVAKIVVACIIDGDVHVVSLVIVDNIELKAIWVELNMWHGERRAPMLRGVIVRDKVNFPGIGSALNEVDIATYALYLFELHA